MLFLGGLGFISYAHCSSLKGYVVARSLRNVTESMRARSDSSFTPGSGSSDHGSDKSEYNDDDLECGTWSPDQTSEVVIAEFAYRPCFRITATCVYTREERRV